MNTPTEYVPIMFDGFDGSALNAGLWVAANNKRGYGQEIFQAENVSVHDSLLDIKCNSDYTSGEITSKGLRSYCYGWYEASMKVPKGSGFWPAFWMLDTSNPQLTYNELDIAEEKTGDATGAGRHYCHIHSGPYPSVHGPAINLGSSVGDPARDLSLSFHRYAMDWRQDGCDFYFDGILFYSAAVAIATPMHTLFSFSVCKPLASGLPPFGGLPDPLYPYPAHLLVDWVWVLKAARHEVQ